MNNNNDIPINQTNTMAAIQLDYLPRMPQDKSMPIGCIGSGFIMADCHLVAYRQAGFNPVAIASRHRENAARVGERHGIARVHDSVDALLADDSVEVLDIAVPPDLQRDVIERS